MLFYRKGKNVSSPPPLLSQGLGWKSWPYYKKLKLRASWIRRGVQEQSRTEKFMEVQKNTHLGSQCTETGYSFTDLSIITSKSYCSNQFVECFKFPIENIIPPHTGWISIFQLIAVWQKRGPGWSSSCPRCARNCTMLRSKRSYNYLKQKPQYNHRGSNPQYPRHCNNAYWLGGPGLWQSV